MQKITFPRVSLWLVGLMFVLPFLSYHHRLPITSFYSEWIAAALGMGAMGLFVRNRYWLDMELPAVAFVPLGFIVILLMQMFVGNALFPEHNVLGASYFLWAALLMLLSRVLLRELGLSEVVETLAWFLVVGGILNAGIAVLQQFNINSFLDPVIVKKVRVPFANLAQPNHFSDYIVLALASLMLLLSRRRLTPWTAAAVGGVLLYVLSFSGSRSSWLYLGALTALSLFFFTVNRQAENKRLAISATFLFPIFILVQFLAPSSVVTPADNLFGLAGSKSDRLAIWLEAWQIFLQAPLLGVGFGEFAWNHFLLSGQVPDVIRGALFNHAHNIILQVLAEFGLLAALLLVYGISACLFRLIKVGVCTPEVWWVLALLSVLAIHSMLEYPLWYTYFLGVAAVLLGLAETRFFSLKMMRVGKSLSVLVLVLGGISLFNLVQNYSAFEGAFYGIGKNLSDRSDLEVIEENARKFVSQVMVVHRESLLSSYAEIAFSRGIVLDKDNLVAKLEVNTRAMHAAPINEIVFRQAILLALNGDDQAAERQFDLSAAAYPRDVEAIVFLLKRKVEQGERSLLALMRHGESWLLAHPEAVRKRASSLGKASVARNGT